MKLKLALVLCMLALVTMIGCSDDDNGVGHDSNLVGTWDITSLMVNGQPVEFTSGALTFVADGTGTATEGGSTESFTWSTSGSNLTVNHPLEGSTTGTYSISGNILTYTYTEEGMSIAMGFTKRT